MTRTTEDETRLTAIRQDWMPNRACDEYQIQPDDRMLEDPCRSCGMPEPVHIVKFLLTQLDAQAQTIATLTEERDEANGFLQDAMSSRDEWKALATSLSARLTRLTEGLRTLRTYDTPSAQEGKFTIVVAHRDIVALFADPETP